MTQDNEHGTTRSFNGLYGYGGADNGVVYDSKPKHDDGDTVITPGLEWYRLYQQLLKKKTDKK